MGGPTKLPMHDCPVTHVVILLLHLTAFYHFNVFFSMLQNRVFVELNSTQSFPYFNLGFGSTAHCALSVVPIILSPGATLLAIQSSCSISRRACLRSLVNPSMAEPISASDPNNPDDFEVLLGMNWLTRQCSR